MSDLTDAVAAANADSAKATAQINAELGGDPARAESLAVVVLCPRCGAGVPTCDRLASHNRVHQLGG